MVLPENLTFVVNIEICFYAQYIKGKWLVKLVARVLSTAALLVRIQTSLKTTKLET
jgi:hypothetical protein